MIRRHVHVLALLLSLVVPASRRADAQRPGRVITNGDLAILGAGTLGSAVLSRYDVKIARFFGDSSRHNHKLDVVAHRTSVVTETLLMISGASVWAIGRLGRSPGTAEVALHTTESVASGAAFIQVIRGIAGRARPFVVEDSGAVHDSDPYDFDWLHGFRSFNYRSFPSMHAMASFAAATALTQEMRVHRTRYRGVLGAMLYSGAVMSPAARMYLDEHWASDIALGAILGIFAGQKVVNYSHEHPRTPVDRFFLKPRANAGISISAGRLAPVFGVSSF